MSWRVRAALVLAGFIGGVLLAFPVGSLWMSRAGGAVTETPLDGKSGSALLWETYLLVGVDDYTKPQPKVEAVWLARLPSDGSVIELVGLPPAPYQNLYSTDVGLPAAALQPYLIGPLVGSVIVDRAGLAVLVERLGGVALDGRMAGGAEVLQFIDASSLADDVNDGMVRQGAVVQGVVARVALAGSVLDWGDVLRVASRSTVPPGKVDELLRRYHPFYLYGGRVRLRLAGLSAF